jgi:hypothetical protein
MATQIKITQLTDIGSANLAVTTLLPVVNMAGVPTTQKTTLGNLANVILSQSGGNYAPVSTANLSYTVANANQPNITSVGTLTNLSVSGNATINGNITSNGTSYLGNISTTGLASITTLQVGATANLGAVSNVKITGGNSGEVLSTDGAGNLSWIAVSGNGTYGNSNVVTLLSNFGSNTITTTGNITANYFVGVATDVIVQAVNNNYSYHMAFVTGNGDTTLHMDADSDLQYNPNDGTMTVVRLDADYVLTDNLWYSNGTPYSFPSTGNITFSGSNISTNVSNADLRINGNGSNGHVVITANGFGWTFEPYGNLSIPDGTILGEFNANSATGFDVQANSQFQIRTQDGNIYDWFFTQGGNFITPGHILPNANITYDLGSNTQRWKDLWISNTTIHLGDIALSVSNSGQLSTSEFIEGGEGVGGIAYIEWTTDSELSIRTDNVSPFIATFESLKINDTFTLLTGGNGAFPANTNLSVSGVISQTTPVPGFIDFTIPVDDVPGANVYVYTFNLTRAPITEFSQLSGNTITLGNAVLTSTGNTLVVDNISITSGNIGNIGNVASVNLDGNANTLLSGNGSWVNSDSFISWVSVPVSNTAPGNTGQAAYDSGGNLYVCVSANTWSKMTGTTSW